jgi:hypothetical protein
MNGLKDHEIRELINYVEKDVSEWITRNIGVKIPNFKLHQCFRNVISSSVVKFFTKNNLRIDWKD